MQLHDSSHLHDVYWGVKSEKVIVHPTCDFPEAGLWLLTDGSNSDFCLVSGSSSMVDTAAAMELNV